MKPDWFDKVMAVCVAALTAGMLVFISVFVVVMLRG
jgi:hypothetical protein